MVTGGLGGMGGAQPLAATMAGATFLGIDVDPSRIEKRMKTRYIDLMTDSYEEAINWVIEAKMKEENISVGLVGNIGEVLEKLIKDDITPDILTDQTSAHDPINGYVPSGISLEEALALRKSDQKEYERKSIASMATHVRHMLTLKDRGAITFDYGNNLRAYAQQGGVQNAFDFPGFVHSTFVHYFVKVKDRFDGQHYQVIHMIFM